MSAANMEHNTSLQNVDGADKSDFTLYGIGAADSSSTVMQDTTTGITDIRLFLSVPTSS